MYSSIILNAKHSKTIRYFYKYISFLICIILVYYYFEIPNDLFIKYKNWDIQLVVFFALFLIILFSYDYFIRKKFIEKYDRIGELFFDETKIIIKTRSIYKEILYSEIEQIKLRRNMGPESKYSTVKSFDTYLASIYFNNNSNINIHLTRELLKNGERQKKKFSPESRDLFDIMEIKRIPFGFDKGINEVNCLQS